MPAEMGMTQTTFSSNRAHQRARGVEFVLITALAAAFSVSPTAGQVLRVDQKAGLDGSLGHVFYPMRTNAPMAQLFTPSSNAVGFVQLGIGGGGPARLHVNLRSGSITGAVLAASRAVNIPSGYKGVVHFGFDTNMAVVPEQPHFFEPVIDSGNDCTLALYHFGYLRGMAYIQGVALKSIYSFWFREGVVADFPRFSNPYVRRDDPERFYVNLAGLPGETVVTESSADGTTWTRLQTNELTGSMTQLVLTNATAPQQFYRVFYPVP